MIAHISRFFHQVKLILPLQGITLWPPDKAAVLITKEFYSHSIVAGGFVVTS